MSAADAGQAQRSTMSAIEKDCTLRLACVRRSHLYSAKFTTSTNTRSTPMCAWFCAGFEARFRRHPENFTFPRYDLDITFFSGSTKTTSRSISTTTCNGRKSASKMAT